MYLESRLKFPTSHLTSPNTEKDELSTIASIRVPGDRLPARGQR